jgi:hypothetical protein
MLPAVDLELRIGPAVPLPAPKDVVDALTAVSVSSGTAGPSAFQLTFELSTRSPLHTLFLLAGGASPLPIVRVVLAVRIGDSLEVLIDGVATSHEIGAGERPGQAKLTVTGEDLSRVMDYVDFSGTPFPAMPDFARVALILAKYAFLGVIPKVIPSVLIDVPLPVQQIPTQQGKDLAYIRMLAERVGYVFYLEPGPAVGTSVAYWGPEVKVGVAQPALSLHMDAHTTVEDLSFDYDSERATLPVVIIHNPETKVPIPIPVPPITPLNPPLGAVPPIPKRIERITESAKYTPVQAALIGLARAARSNNVARARGRLDVRRYGRLLKPRKLVGVRGAGPAFDGLWFVERVSSELRRGGLTQSFELTRNGLLPTVDRVAA